MYVNFTIEVIHMSQSLKREGCNEPDLHKSKQNKTNESAITANLH